MSCVETKAPGHFTKGVSEKRCDKRGFGTERFYLRDDDLAYALGREGATRIKLATASHAILQYVGNLVFIAGTGRERSRCYEYLRWLLDQRQRTVVIEDTANRDDVMEVHVPRNCVGFVTRDRGEALRY